jgi:hypothetical protein
MAIVSEHVGIQRETSIGATKPSHREMIESPSMEDLPSGEYAAPPKATFRSQMHALLLSLALRQDIPKQEIDSRVAKHALALSIPAKVLKRRLEYHDPARRKAAAKDLTALAKHYASLADVVSQLEKSAAGQLALEELAVVGLLDPDELLASFRAHLADLQVKANQAEIASRAFEPNQRGRPIKQLASIVATRAAAAFEDITGRRATTSVDPRTGKRSGTFITFLAEVYDILDVNASPEAMAVKALSKAKVKNAAAP